MIVSRNQSPVRRAIASSRQRRGEKVHGAPCVHGHGTLRYLSSGGCVICIQIAAQAKRDEFKRQGKIYNPRTAHTSTGDAT